MIFNGYCKELNLAFEYNGRQHYKFIKHFHKNYETFLKRCSFDKDKKQKCRENNTKLLIIPHSVKKENLETFIKLKLLELSINFDFKKNINYENINFRNKYLEKRNKIVDDQLKHSKFKRISNFTKFWDKLMLKCKICSYKKLSYFRNISQSNYTRCIGCSDIKKKQKLDRKLEKIKKRIITHHK